ncbi:MAG: DUF2225 domain-containing protein [Lachnospiraceae bacterium]|nr:DUF2225 domain-containing protein [Lachnospiraceae bacterium]
MVDLFSGLESLGIEGLGDLDIYDDDFAKNEEGAEDSQKTVKVRDPEEVEAEYVFDKTYTCPVCDRSFKSKTLKSNKAKLISTDMDLRPVHQNIDIVKYDVVACPCCGYAVLNRYFAPLTSMQVKKIKEAISKNYKIKEEKKNKIYSYDEAIERSKLALLSSVIKTGKDSEKAYVCLKTAWLFRGKAEHLPETEIEEIKRCQREEEAFLSKAYDGMVAARRKELFPICGMDELTFDYLLAALAHRLGHLEVSAKLVGEIMAKPTANRRIKEKTGILKEVLKKDIQAKKQNE